MQSLRSCSYKLQAHTRLLRTRLAANVAFPTRYQLNNGGMFTQKMNLSTFNPQNVRNVAIIAHVDHGMSI